MKFLLHPCPCKATILKSKLWIGTTRNPGPSEQNPVHPFRHSPSGLRPMAADLPIKQLDFLCALEVMLSHAGSLGCRQGWWWCDQMLQRPEKGNIGGDCPHFHQPPGWPRRGWSWSASSEPDILADHVLRNFPSVLWLRWAFYLQRIFKSGIMLILDMETFLKVRSFQWDSLENNVEVCHLITICSQVNDTVLPGPTPGQWPPWQLRRRLVGTGHCQRY